VDGEDEVKHSSYDFDLISRDNYVFLGGSDETYLLTQGFIRDNFHGTIRVVCNSWLHYITLNAILSEKQDSWAIAKKTARCAQDMGALKSFDSPHYAVRTRLLVPEICNGLFFRSILRMCIQNLKFVALPVPEIIGGTQKIWAVPGYPHAPFSPIFLKGFCSHGLCEYTCQVWSS